MSLQFFDCKKNCKTKRFLNYVGADDAIAPDAGIPPSPPNAVAVPPSPKPG